MYKEYYLDNSATTPVSKEVANAMEPYWAIQFGNPSSPHERGVAAEKTLRSCRQHIADLLEVRPSEIVFTGSGTESNNLALQGVARSKSVPGHLITSVIEHPSVLEVAKYLETQGWAVTYLPVSENGQISVDDFQQSLRPNTEMVSLMMVNNELGTILPINEIGKVISEENSNRQRKIVFHVDAVQAVGKVDFHLPSSSIDLLTISGHKIFGPKGVGALFVRRGTPLKPLILGGGQELGYRSGTEAIPHIVGLTKALHLAYEHRERNQQRLTEIRQSLLDGLLNIPRSFLNSPITEGAPHIINIGFSEVPAEVLVHFLEQDRIYVSIGAACSGKRKEFSHVLKAIGLPKEKIKECIRISLAPDLLETDVTTIVSVFCQTVSEIRQIYQ